ncbi:MAG: transketolase [Clostridia bacterium]
MNLIDSKAISTMRVLTADAVQKANSGHPGLAIGASPMAYALWRQMRHNPKDPNWAGRDRFVLSAGHASMLLYSLLHLFGYELSMDDIKEFRQWGSKTPGHPEYMHTAGVEATSGPLGQGIAMATGMAMAQAHLAAVFNRDGYPVVDNYTYVLMGDGCMMEGVASEAASLAGTMKLGKLIALYDSNRITIEGSTDITFTEDVAARFSAYGWHVQQVEDGEDIDAIDMALSAAKAENCKPSLIIVHTDIAHGTPKQGKSSAHGEPLGAENILAMKQALGWEYDEFTVPEDVAAHFAAMLSHFAAMQQQYDDMMISYKAAYPELYAQWQAWHDDKLPEKLLNDKSLWQAEGPKATRATGGDCLNKLCAYLPNMFGGSADLAPSNKTEMKGRGYFEPNSYDGANIHFGVREFAMAAACNGMALYGGIRPYCATFLVFMDYLKPAIRLAALMKLPVMYILTHDSIGVGEDGPTHQPIEQLASLRAIPGTLTFRPADAKETAACYIAALQSRMPSAFALTRQNLPQYAETGIAAMRGGYILREPKGGPDVILIATGSEVELIYKAADILSVQGYTARLVSMPCVELFEQQDKEYRESVFPRSITKRVAVEAGTSFGWDRFTGLDGKVVSIDHFGASAPAGRLFSEFGMTAQRVAAVALEMLKG